MPKPLQIMFPQYFDNNGALSVYESGKNVPFVPLRVFTVTAAKGDERGDHAHKKCSQLLICVHGKIVVSCDDGVDQSEYVLDSINSGLLVPPGVWAKESYVSDSGVLVVLCDRVYEEDDYIRSYSEFKDILSRRTKYD